jgi:antirestriction protein
MIKLKRESKLNRRFESSSSKKVLRGALTNLGKYNEGTLDYVWVSFPCDEKTFNNALKKIGVSSEPNKDGVVYDEWFFTDWDTDYDWVSTDGLGEYESFDDVNEFAEALESVVDNDMEEEFKAAMEYTADDFRRSLDLVDNNEVIKISDESLSNKMDEEIGYYYIDNLYGDLSEVSHPESYFDYEAFGRDVRLEYYQDGDDMPETAGEYWCGDEDASDEEIGEAIVDDLGWEGVGKENMERYFDYEKFGRDIRIEGSFVQTDDGIFEITE